MALEVYWGSGSAPAWRVLLALTVKGISYESKLLSFAKREHKSPDFLSINPRGKLPALRDGEYTLYESFAIVTYLDRKYPSPPLFGESAEEAGLIMRLISEHDSYLYPPIHELSRPLLFTGVEGKEAELKSAAGRVHEELDRLEKTLKGPDYLTGDRISAADIVVYPSLQFMQRAASRPAGKSLDLGLFPLEQRYPKLGAFCRRIEALPGYDATYPPHWRESP